MKPVDSAIVDKVRELVKAAVEPPTLTVTGEDARYFWLRDPKSGGYEPRVKRVNERLSVLSLASLADFARNFPHGELWFSRAGVTYAHDPDGDNARADHPDRATLALKQSPAFATLARWAEARQPVKQDEAVRLLRTTFRDSVHPGTLADTLSAIKWAVDERGQSAIGTGTRSVGKNIESRLEGRSAIPETVTFTVPAWETGGPQLNGFEITVGCVLEVDAPNCTFAFIPFGGSVESAWALAEAELERLLRLQVARAFGADAGDGSAPAVPPIYHGVPANG